MHHSLGSLRARNIPWKKGVLVGGETDGKKGGDSEKRSQTDRGGFSLRSSQLKDTRVRRHGEGRGFWSGGKCVKGSEEVLTPMIWSGRNQKRNTTRMSKTGVRIDDKQNKGSQETENCAQTSRLGEEKTQHARQGDRVRGKGEGGTLLNM